MFFSQPMSETIGQQLKKTRLEKNLSIEQVVQATRIRAHAIQALEADDFDNLPSATQVRGFLRIYVDFLGLSLEDLFARQRQAAQDTNQVAPPPVVETSVQEPITETTAVSVPETPIPAAPDAQPPVDENPPRKIRSRKKGIKQANQEEPPSQSSVSSNQVAPTAPQQQESAALENSALAVTSPAMPDSQEIFTSIGNQLRQRRESLGLSLEEIERHISVRKRSLDLLESGQFDRLPSSVQARGMLNNYARFLDMDIDSLLLEFANGLQVQLAERHPVQEPANKRGKETSSRLKLPASVRRILTPDLLVGGILIITLLAFATWGTGRIIRQNASKTPEPTPQSISNVLLTTPLPGEALPTGTSVSGTAAPTVQGLATLQVTLPPASNLPVQVVLVASRSTWVKVTSDNQVKFEGRAVAGTAYTYEANTQIEVSTGDGAALSIIYNQSNLGPMGAYGEFVVRIYTATTILVPTATFTPSPTITPTPTITPRPSRTLPITPTLNP